MITTTHICEDCGVEMELVTIRDDFVSPNEDCDYGFTDTLDREAFQCPNCNVFKPTR